MCAGKRLVGIQNECIGGGDPESRNVKFSLRYGNPSSSGGFIKNPSISNLLLGKEMLLDAVDVEDVG